MNIDCNLYILITSLYNYNLNLFVDIISICADDDILLAHTLAECDVYALLCTMYLAHTYLHVLTSLGMIFVERWIIL